MEPNGHHVDIPSNYNTSKHQQPKKKMSIREVEIFTIRAWPHWSISSSSVWWYFTDHEFHHIVARSLTVFQNLGYLLYLERERMKSSSISVLPVPFQQHKKTSLHNDIPDRKPIITLFFCNKNNNNFKKNYFLTQTDSVC